MKFLILLFLIAYYSKAIILLRTHQRWSLSNKKSAASKIPYLDFYWNYCDKKCLYLKNYLQSYNDKNKYKLVVVQFTEQDDEDNFAVCYVLQKQSETYYQWTKFITNDWYLKICGFDEPNLMKSHRDWRQVPQEQILNY